MNLELHQCRVALQAECQCGNIGMALSVNFPGVLCQLFADVEACAGVVCGCEGQVVVAVLGIVCCWAVGVLPGLLDCHNVWQVAEVSLKEGCHGPILLFTDVVLQDSELVYRHSGVLFDACVGSRGVP